MMGEWFINAARMAHELCEAWSPGRDPVPGLLCTVTVFTCLKRSKGNRKTETTGRKPTCTLAIMLA